MPSPLVPSPAGAADPEELVEDALFQFGRNAAARIGHHNAHDVALRRCFDRDAAALGVLDRVVDQVGEDALQHERVGFQPQTGVLDVQPESLLPGKRRELRPQRAGKPRHRKAAPRYVHPARVEPRDVEQAVELILQQTDGLMDALRQPPILARRQALAQDVDQQADSMQRLPQVVAGGGDETGLGLVGRDGHMLLGVHLLQQGGNLAPAQEIQPTEAFEQVANEGAHDEQGNQEDAGDDQRLPGVGPRAGCQPEERRHHRQADGGGIDKTLPQCRVAVDQHYLHPQGENELPCRLGQEGHHGHGTNAERRCRHRRADLPVRL